MLYNLDDSQRSVLVEIAEETYKNGVDVFETESYDDLGRQGLEVAGAASVLREKLSVDGDLELSDDFVKGFVVLWCEMAIDAYSDHAAMKSIIAEELVAKFTA